MKVNHDIFMYNTSAIKIQTKKKTIWTWVV